MGWVVLLEHFDLSLQIFFLVVGRDSCVDDSRSRFNFFWVFFPEESLHIIAVVESMISRSSDDSDLFILTPSSEA